VRVAAGVAPCDSPSVRLIGEEDGTELILLMRSVTGVRTGAVVVSVLVAAVMVPLVDDAAACAISTGWVGFPWLFTAVATVERSDMDVLLLVTRLSGAAPAAVAAAAAARTLSTEGL